MLVFGLVLMHSCISCQDILISNSLEEPNLRDSSPKSKYNLFDNGNSCWQQFTKYTNTEQMIKVDPAFTFKAKK